MHSVVLSLGQGLLFLISVFLGFSLAVLVGGAGQATPQSVAPCSPPVTSAGNVTGSVIGEHGPEKTEDTNPF